MSLSLLLGLALLIQPTVLFPDNEDYQTVPASPIDLPPIGDYQLDVPMRWAYAAACTSATFMALSLGLLSRASKAGIYHGVACNSLVSFLATLALLPVWVPDKEDTSTLVIPSLKHGLLLLAITVISFAGQLFQALALHRKSPRQLSLISFVQPIFSTGLQTAFLDRTVDVLPLAGSVLIAANV